MGAIGQLLGRSHKSIYEDDLPDLREGESRDYAIADHHLRVTVTGELGCDTGRRRYRVECLTCAEIVHVATTGASWNMETHVRRAARGEGVSGPSDRTLVWHHLVEASRHLRVAAALVDTLESAETLAELVSRAEAAMEEARSALEKGERNAG